MFLFFSLAACWLRYIPHSCWCRGGQARPTGKDSLVPPPLHDANRHILIDTSSSPPIQPMNNLHNTSLYRVLYNRVNMYLLLSIVNDCVCVYDCVLHQLWSTTKPRLSTFLETERYVELLLPNYLDVLDEL